MSVTETERQTAELEALIAEVLGRMASNPAPPMPEAAPLTT